MKFAIYNRTSTDKQDSSLEQQLQKCRMQVELLNGEVVAELQDFGRSGKSMEREGLAKLMEQCEKGEITHVVIYHLSRLTRSMFDLSYLLQFFEKHNIALISVTDSLNTGSPSGKLIINILGTINEFERETIVHRVKKNLEFRREQGKKYSGITPYGFRLEGDNLIPEQSEQEAIKVIMTEKSNNVAFHRIATKLDNLGYKTRKGAKWHFGSVRAIYLRQLRDNKELA